MFLITGLLRDSGFVFKLTLSVNYSFHYAVIPPLPAPGRHKQSDKSFVRCSNVLIWSRFSIDKIPRVVSPVLVIHGTEDEVIDFSHGLAIYERCPRAVEPLWVEVRLSSSVKHPREICSYCQSEDYLLQEVIENAFKPYTRGRQSTIFFKQVPKILLNDP